MSAPGSHYGAYAVFSHGAAWAVGVARGDWVGRLSSRKLSCGLLIHFFPLSVLFAAGFDGPSTPLPATLVLRLVFIFP